MFKFYRLYPAIIILYMMTTPAVGETNPTAPLSSPEEISIHLKKIMNKTGALPLEQLSELDKIIDITKKNSWKKSLIVTVSYKVRVLLWLERIDQAEQLLKLYLVQARQIQLKPSVARLLMSKLRIIDAKGESPLTIRKELLTLSENMEDKIMVVEILIAVARSQAIMEEYRLAMANLKKAQEVHADSQDKNIESGILVALGNIYLELGESKKAIDYYQEALSIEKKFNDIFNKSILYFNIGKSYLQLKDYSAATDYLTQAVDFSRKINDKVGEAWAQSMLADIQLQQNYFEQAHATFSAASRVFLKVGDKRMYNLSQLGRVEALIKLQRVVEANDIQQQIKLSPNEKGNASTYLRYLKALSDIEYANKNYKKALDGYIEYSSIQEKKYRKDRKEGIQRLMIKFDIDKKETENKILQKENELQLLRLEKQNQQRILWILISSIAAIVVVIVTIVLFKQIKHRNRFRRMAMLDHLTGAPNRRAILEFAETCYHESKATKDSFSLAIIDLDHFKRVNDTYGHAIGDKVLIEFSNCCKSILRNQDHFGRFGGEEWLLVLPNTKIEDIEIVFRRLRKSLQNTTMEDLPENANVTFSMGAAEMQPDDINVEAIIHRADSKLYQAKSSGRDQLAV